MFDLTDVGFVKRVTLGSRNPESLSDESEIAAAEALLNRCLVDLPRGKILGVEKSFTLLNVGEHAIVLQWLTYHVGFPRRPSWLDV